ncbi:hypothetical protein Pen01_10200 [Phytomonospora endophytica]|nr:hypothetical protein Pen01_10200 [Phytomonospora endophytica]
MAGAGADRGLPERTGKRDCLMPGELARPVRPEVDGGPARENVLHDDVARDTEVGQFGQSFVAVSVAHSSTFGSRRDREPGLHRIRPVIAGPQFFHNLHEALMVVADGRPQVGRHTEQSALLPALDGARAAAGVVTQDGDPIGLPVVQSESEEHGAPVHHPQSEPLGLSVRVGKSAQLRVG